MEKEVLVLASCYKRLYYINKDFDNIPIAVKNKLKTICICLAEKLHCIFSIGFYDNGKVYIEAMNEESDYNFDEIGAKLEIKQLEKNESQLLESLEFWYIIYKTKKGKNFLNGTT